MEKDETLNGTELKENQTNDFAAQESETILINNLNDSTTEIEEVENTASKESEDEIEKQYAHLSLQEIVETLEEIVKEKNITKIKLKVSILKAHFLEKLKVEKQAILDQFISEGGNKEDFVPEEHPLETRYRNAFVVYKENKQKLLEEYEEIKQKNLQLKQHILNELKELIETETNLKKLYDHFKELQDKWNEIGNVPQNEISNLWQIHHFYVEKFFDKVRINKELKDLDMKKNLEQKIELCEKAENLILETSINTSFKELQKLHELWHEIGPVPEEQKDEIWNRFKNATDQINQRRREFYDNLIIQQQTNYEAKIVLCDKMEHLYQQEFNSLKELHELTKKVEEILNTWKTIGPASQKVNDEIWNRFKEYLNVFYTRKKEYLSKIKEQQTENYNAKINLCIQAEAIAKRQDWKKATEALLNLQSEWKKTGSAPRKFSDAVWNRFRTACDTFFDAKKDFFEHINEHETENLTKKETLIEKVKNFQLVEDKKENMDMIKMFQREWSEIGHVPVKDKNRLYDEFITAINALFETLKISSAEIKRANYNNHLDEIMSNSDNQKIIEIERRNITTKIQTLKDDVNLWENNLGFFAQSKNADLLKKDFLKKIDKTKEEIKDLEEKLKILMQRKG